VKLISHWIGTDERVARTVQPRSTGLATGARFVESVRSPFRAPSFSESR